VAEHRIKPAAMPAPAAAEYLGIGLSSLYSLARDGKVESFTSGRRRLFTTASLDRYIEHRRTAEGCHFRPQNLPWERPRGTPRRHSTQSGKDKAAPASAAASDRTH
jgi:excisionase family DNA binding protein